MDFHQTDLCIDVEIRFGLLMGEFCKFLTVICPTPSELSFPDDISSISGFSPNLVCTDIMEIWFGIANGQIASIFDRGICPLHDVYWGIIVSGFFFFYFVFLTVVPVLRSFCR